jgi:hypothetical protein
VATRRRRSATWCSASARRHDHDVDDGAEHLDVDEHVDFDPTGSEQLHVDFHVDVDHDHGSADHRTSTTVPEETTTTTVPEETTTTTVPEETTTSTTTVIGSSTIVTTTTEPTTTTCTSRAARFPRATTPTTVTPTGSLPFTGSGSAVAAMFGILCIAAGALMLAGKRSRSHS